MHYEKIPDSDRLTAEQRLKLIETRENEKKLKIQESYLNTLPNSLEDLFEKYLDKNDKTSIAIPIPDAIRMINYVEIKVGFPCFSGFSKKLAPKNEIENKLAQHEKNTIEKYRKLGYKVEKSESYYHIYLL